MVGTLRRNASPARARKEEAIEFRLIFMVSFAIFLLVATFARLLPRDWRPYPAGPEGYASVFDEARSAANTFVPFAFMG